MVGSKTFNVMKKLSVFLLMAVLGATWPAVAADAWKAGAAKTIITPTAPVWMSGYIRDRPSEGTAQDLWAKALVLEDAAGQRTLLITMDLVGIDRATSQQICQRLSDKYGLKRAQIALNFSHTHHGPAVGRNLYGLFAMDDAQWNRIDQYTAGLADKLVALAGEAIDHLEPATVSCGRGFCTVAVNRRTNTRKDAEQVRENGQLLGPSDFDVPVLGVRDATGKLQAIVFGYACHPTTLVVDYEFSGDYAGYAQSALEESHAGAIAMFWQGCGGDQAPRPKDTVELTQAYGRRLAAAVDEVLRGAMRPLAASVATRYEEIPLRLAPTPDRDALEKEKASSNKFIARRAVRELAELDAGRPLRTTYPYPVQVWQLDDLRWVFLGGEVVVDYSLRLKRELGPTRTWVAGYSNDVMAYIPSLRVLREGGYEPINSLVYYDMPAAWSAEVEVQIIEAVTHACRQLPAAAQAWPVHS